MPKENEDESDKTAQPSADMRLWPREVFDHVPEEKMTRMNRFARNHFVPEQTGAVASVWDNVPFIQLGQPDELSPTPMGARSGPENHMLVPKFFSDCWFKCRF